MGNYKVLFDFSEQQQSKPKYTKIFDFGSDVVETVGGAVSSGFDKMQQLGEKTLEGVKVASSTPVRTMLEDIFIPKFITGDITESNFSPEAIDVLRKAALGKNLKPGKPVKLSYEDYNKYGAKISASFFGSNVADDTASLKEKLKNITPADELKMTLGEILVSVDEDGNITAQDQYDFNSWTHFGRGKDNSGRYSNLSADEFEKSGIPFMEAVMDSVKNAPSDYQMIRNLAFLFGSRDYEGTERDTGRQVTLQLGKLGA
tara:strand:+ start:22478 stop:23254 length:777 start_codon:yes stop_codon:yes gene_type:complete